MEKQSLQAKGGIEREELEALVARGMSIAQIAAILVQEAGGRCVAWGSSRNARALQFHHVDPATKRLGLSGQGVTYSLEVLRNEARKCILLCANCHAEVEDGRLDISVQLAA